jgi:hypothetical protein
MPVISALRMLRQEDLELQGQLGLHSDTVSQTKIENRRERKRGRERKRKKKTEEG